MGSELIISFILGVIILSIFIILFNKTATPQAIQRNNRKKEKYKEKRKMKLQTALNEGLSEVKILQNTFQKRKKKSSDSNMNISFSLDYEDGGEYELTLSAHFNKNMFIKNLVIRKETLSDKASKVMGLEEPAIHKTDFDGKYYISSNDAFSHLVFTKDARYAWSKLYDVTSRAYNFKLIQSKLQFSLSTERISPVKLKKISKAFAEAAKTLGENISEEIILLKTLKYETDPLIVYKTCLYLFSKENQSNINTSALIEALKNRSPNIQIAAATGLHCVDESFFKILVTENNLDPYYVSCYLNESKMGDLKLLKNLFGKYNDDRVRVACIQTLSCLAESDISDFLIDHYARSSSEVQFVMLTYFMQNSSMKMIEKLSILSKSLSGTGQGKITSAIKAMQKSLDTGEAGWVSLNKESSQKGKLSIAEKDGKLSLQDEES